MTDPKATTLMGQIGSRQNMTSHEGTGRARNKAEKWLRSLNFFALLQPEFRTYGAGTTRDIKGNTSNTDSGWDRQGGGVHLPSRISPWVDMQEPSTLDRKLGDT